MIIDKIINKEEIYEAVATETAWMGKTDGDIDEKSIGESEKTIFDRFFSLSISELDTLMARYGIANEVAEGAKIYLSMPANFDADATESLITLAKKYMTRHIVTQWSAMVRDDRATIYQQQTLSAATEIMKILNKRIKNTR